MELYTWRGGKRQTRNMSGQTARFLKRVNRRSPRVFLTGRGQCAMLETRDTIDSNTRERGGSYQCLLLISEAMYYCTRPRSIWWDDRVQE